MKRVPSRSLTPVSFGTVNWVPYVESKIITPKEKNLLDELENSTGGDVFHPIMKKLEDYCELFLKLLKNVHQGDAILFVLNVMLVMFRASSKFSVQLGEYYEDFDSFLEHNENDSLEIVNMSYIVFILYFPSFFLKNEKRILAKDEDEDEKKERKVSQIELKAFLLKIQRFFESTHRNVKKHLSNPTLIITFLAGIMTVIKKKPFRKTFVKCDGINLLVDVLQKYRHNIQIEYNCVFILWNISFEEELCRSVYYHNVLLHALIHDILKVQKKEKVKRIILLTYKNFLTHPKILSELINLGVYKTLNGLRRKKYEDKDIAGLLNLEIEKIDVHIKEISSFSEYRQEILLGKLEWSPAHRSEKFWKENFSNLEENNFFIIKRLLSILDTGVVDIVEEVAEGKDERKRRWLNLSIALFDIGQFLRFYPRAKKVMKKLGGKKKILELMEHPDEEVRKQALLCTQKLLVDKWEYL